MAFARTVNWMMPSPVHVDDVSWHGLDAHGLTNTGAALKALSEDPAPGSTVDGGAAVAVLLVSDGMPTKPSEYREGLEILQSRTWWRDATRVAIAIGPDADRRSLADFASEAERGIRTQRNLRNWLQVCRPRSRSCLRASLEPAHARSLMAPVVWTRRRWPRSAYCRSARSTER